ncbi:MAG TPA: dTMP kinase [Bryobacteraceae bacterium]|nr:dTMP kinase [Bryobacteraceae bacterium]
MSTTRQQGFFITFEGADGSGKSTQMRLFAARLRQAGHTVVETVEPGGTRIGGAIRAILLNPENHDLSPRAELLLYFAARAQNVDQLLLPALERGEIVLSDRWTDSTYAYQGHGRQLGTDVVVELDHVACRGHRPDLTIWVDIDLETGLERARARNAETGASAESRMDEQARDFYARVRQGYVELERLDPGRIRRVEGAGTPEEVAERVWAEWRRFEAAHV